MVDAGKKSPLQRATQLRDAAADAVVAAGRNLLDATIGAFSEDTATGLARVRRILHDAEAGPLFRRLGHEFGELVKKGKVKAERITDPEVRTTLASIAEDLEKEVPDQRRLELLRRVFLAVVMGDPTDRDATMTLLFVRAARQLRGEDVAVLASAYRHRGDHLGRDALFSCFGPWSQSALSETGISFRVALYEAIKRLQELHLFQGEPSQSLTWYPNPSGPFTDFGIAFCEFLQRAEPFPEPPPKPAKPAT